MFASVACLTLAISSSHRVLNASTFCCISSSRTPPSISVWASSRIWFLLSSGCRRRTSRLCVHTQNVISHTFTDLIFWVLKLKPSAWRRQWYCDTVVVLFLGDSQRGRRGKLKIMQGKSVRWWPAEAKRGQLALVRLTPALNSFSHLLKSAKKRSVWLISRAFSRVEQSWVGRYLHFRCFALP